MKKRLLGILSVVAVAVCAAVFVPSCDAIEKASERDFEVGDFKIPIVVAPADALSRAEGATRFTGSYVIKRDELLEGVPTFDYQMIKSVTLSDASIDVVQDLPGITIENLELSCPGLTTVTITDTPLNDIGNAENDALKNFIAGLLTKIIREGEAEVSLDTTFDQALTQPVIGYLIDLSGIMVRAGLNL